MTPSPIKKTPLSKTNDDKVVLSLRKITSNVEAVAAELSKDCIEKTNTDDTNNNNNINNIANSPKKIFSIAKCPDALK